MKRKAAVVLTVTVGLVAAAAAVVLSQTTQEPVPEEPTSVENTRAPGEISEEWDDERREEAEPHDPFR